MRLRGFLYEMNRFLVRDEAVSCTRLIGFLYEIKRFLVRDEYMSCTR